MCQNTTIPSNNNAHAATDVSVSELQRRRSTIGLGKIDQHHPEFRGIDPNTVGLVLKNIKNTDRDGDGRISTDEYIRSCINCVNEAQAFDNLLRNFRRAIAAMLILLLLLCCALFGVSYGVAELSKEVTVSSGARMTLPGSGELVKTGVSGSELITLQPAAPLPPADEELVSAQKEDEPYKLDLVPALQDINGTSVASLFSDGNINDGSSKASEEVEQPKEVAVVSKSKSLGCLVPEQVDVLENDSFFTGTVIKSPDGTSHVIQVHDLEPKSDGGAVIYDTSGKKYLLTKNDKSCSMVMTSDGRRLSGEGDDIFSLMMLVSDDGEDTCPTDLAAGAACTSTCLYSCPKGHSCVNSYCCPIDPLAFGDACFPNCPDSCGSGLECPTGWLSTCQCPSELQLGDKCSDCPNSCAEGLECDGSSCVCPTDRSLQQDDTCSSSCPDSCQASTNPFTELVTGLRCDGDHLQCLRLKWIEYGDFHALDYHDDSDFNNDDFGRSVSLSEDGSTLAIGSPGYDGNWGKNSSPGTVRVLRFNDQTRLWDQLGADINCCATCHLPENLNIAPELIVPQNGCGGSVSLSSDGNRLAIGGFGDNGNRDYTYGKWNHPGRVEIHEYNEEANLWSQLGRTIMGDVSPNPDDAASVAWLGYSESENSLDFTGRIGYSLSLSKDGMVVAIGSPFVVVDGYQSGKVRVYRWDTKGSDWIPIGLNTPLVGARDDSFGMSVSISNNGGVIKVAIGAPSSWEPLGGPSIGSRYTSGFMYGRGQVWTMQLIAQSRGINLADLEELIDLDRGYVRVYQYINEQLGFVQLGTDIFASSVGELDRFGYSVSLSEDGSRLAVGAPFRTERGQVFVYQYDGCEWDQVGDVINGDESDVNLEDGKRYTYYLGMSVSLSADGNTVASASIPYETKRFQVHSYDGSAWDKVGQVIVGRGDMEDRHRIHGDVALSADGDKVAIGMPFEDGWGRVRVYSFGGDCAADGSKGIDKECTDCPNVCASGLECRMGTASLEAGGYYEVMKCLRVDAGTQQLGDGCWRFDMIEEGFDNDVSCAAGLTCTGVLAESMDELHKSCA